MCKVYLCPSSPDWGFGRCWKLDMPDHDLASLFFFGCGHFIDTTMIHVFGFSYWFFRGKEQPWHFNPEWIFQGCWMLLIWVWHLDFNFEIITGLWYTHNPNVHWVLNGALIDCWRFLTGVWHVDLDLDMVTGLWYTHDPNFGSLFWFCRRQEHICPWSPDFGLWMMPEDPDWGLASWFWFGYGQWSLVHPCSKLWLYLDFEVAKNIIVL